MTTDQPSSSPGSTAQTRTPPPGISGKQVTLWVLVGLGLIAIALSYTLWSYSRLEIARRASHEAWREVAEHLSPHYRAAERAVALQVDSRRLPMEIGEKFRLAIDAFHTTSLPEQQFAAAVRVEELLADKQMLEVRQTLPQLSERAHASIDSFNQSRRLEQQLLDGWGGRVLDIFLKLETPTQFPVP